MMERIEQALLELLSDPSPAVRQAASSSLDRVRARRSVEAFRKVLREGSLEERVRVVFSAEDIGGPEGSSLLLAALSDREDEVRGAAARALAAFPTVPVLKALIERLPKERGVVLGNVLEALGASRRKELAPIVARFLGHAEAEVAAKAVEAYALLAERDGWEKVLLQARSASEAVRAAAARALSGWSAGEPSGS